MSDDRLIRARKEIEVFRAELDHCKGALKAAREAFEAANEDFLRMFDEANELNLFVDVETGELHS